MAGIFEESYDYVQYKGAITEFILSISRIIIIRFCK